MFSRSGCSVVRSASLAKGGTSKKRPSPHLHKVPNRSNKGGSTNFANGPRMRLHRKYSKNKDNEVYEKETGLSTLVSVAEFDFVHPFRK
jgi:hypothetical protein